MRAFLMGGPYDGAEITDPRAWKQDVISLAFPQSIAARMETEELSVDMFKDRFAVYEIDPETTDREGKRVLKFRGYELV